MGGKIQVSLLKTIRFPRFFSAFRAIQALKPDLTVRIWSVERRLWQKIGHRVLCNILGSGLPGGRVSGLDRSSGDRGLQQV
jgi:hypothetical protein